MCMCDFCQRAAARDAAVIAGKEQHRRPVSSRPDSGPSTPRDTAAALGRINDRLRQSGGRLRFDTLGASLPD